MDKRNKELLAKDICARLPYGVKVGFSDKDSVPFHIVNYNLSVRELEVEEESLNSNLVVKHIYPIDYYRPYLRPMSSMTDEEADQFAFISDQFLDNGEREEVWDLVIDWLNEHHFDHRHLIEKGLALKAPKNMYNF